MPNQIALFEYSQNFIGDEGPFLILGSIIVAWFGLMAISCTTSGLQDRSVWLPEIDHLIGRSLLRFVFPRAKFGGYVGAFHARRVQPVRDIVDDMSLTAIIVYTQLPEYQVIFERDLLPRTSYLLKRDAIKKWQVVKTWQHLR